MSHLKADKVSQSRENKFIFNKCLEDMNNILKMLPKTYELHFEILHLPDNNAFNEGHNIT